MFSNMNTKYIIVGILCVLLVILGSWVMFKDKNIYEYDVKVSSAGGYSALLDFNHNYFTDQQGKILLPFTSFGGAVADGWAGGQQATAMGIKAPLPYGVKVRWFSITENQFWEGDAVLNQEKLEQLKHYRIHDVLYHNNNNFLDLSDFVINYAPGGLVTIWMTGNSEEYLITQFKAHKIEVLDWDSFIQPVLGEKISRKDYLAFQMDLKNGGASLDAKIRQEVLTKTVPGAEQWLRLMKQYSWFLKTNSSYELKGYFANYLNGEQYSTQQNQDQIKKLRAIPIAITVLLKSYKTKENIRLDFDFNKEEIMDGFEKLSQNQQGSEPIQLYLDINDTISEVSVYLIKGSEKIEIKNAKITQKDFPE